jgi:hypothetical protein
LDLAAALTMIEQDNGDTADRDQDNADERAEALGSAPQTRTPATTPHSAKL